MPSSYLHDAIIAALRDDADRIEEDKRSGAIFSPRRFRDEFYNRYFFLFRKNLTNSDVPFGELRSLLQIHIRNHIAQRLPIQFDTSKQLSDTLNRIWNALPTDLARPDSKASLLIDTFADLLTYSIAVDPLYGSCVVHIPKPLTINLQQIVAESGYVYAAGHAIFVRKTQKATKSLFRRNLLSYLRTAGIDPSRKLAFLINSPQLFPITEYNREVASQLRHGLDDVKISLDKFFFEDVPLYDFRNEMREDPELSQYLKFVDIEHSKYDPDSSNTDHRRSIWLIAEQDVGPQQFREAPDRYFACYVQEFVNRNQLHLFNERKPAWISPITLPQTLAAAMINLSRPYLRSAEEGGEPLEFLDPFGGTGTTLLEALKLNLNVTFSINDINNFNKIVVMDNLAFFSAGRSELEDIRTTSRELRELLKSETGSSIFQTSFAARPQAPDSAQALLRNAIAQYRIQVEQYEDRKQTRKEGMVPKFEFARGIHSHSFSSHLQGEFEGWSLKQRMIFYITWRALVKNTFALVNERDHAKIAQQVLAEEFGLFEYELKTLIRDCYSAGSHVEGVGCVLADGRYSRSSIVAPPTFGSALRNGNFAPWVEWSSLDAIDLLTRSVDSGRRYDLILTDPPYGINALEGSESAALLVRLYSKFLELAVRALKDRGQLILCVLENTHNGQNVPSYMTRDIVVREILINAEKAGMEMVNPSLDSPSPDDIFLPPYYWESERTLRRAVLHFIARKR